MPHDIILLFFYFNVGVFFHYRPFTLYQILRGVFGESSFLALPSKIMKLAVYVIPVFTYICWTNPYLIQHKNAYTVVWVMGAGFLTLLPPALLYILKTLNKSHVFVEFVVPLTQKYLVHRCLLFALWGFLFTIVYKIMQNTSVFSIAWEKAQIFTITHLPLIFILIEYSLLSIRIWHNTRNILPLKFPISYYMLLYFLIEFLTITAGWRLWVNAVFS